MKLSRTNRFALLTLAALSASSHAASLTWNGGTAIWDVNNTTNWLDGVTPAVWPAPSGTDDDAVFPTPANTVSIDTGGVIANDLTFNVNGYTLNGDTLTLNGTTPTVTTATSVTSTIESVIDGSAGLVKAGTGSLVLTADNTYSGGTTISAGTLFIGNNGSTGSLGTGTVTNNSTLYFRRTGAHTVANDISGTSGITFSTTSASSPTLSGTLSVGSMFVQNRSTVTLSGSSANTTGNVTIDSAQAANISTLILGKTDGTIAVSGDISMGHYGGSAKLELAASDQIADTSTVSLNAGGAYSNNAAFSLMGNDETIGWLQGTGSRAPNTIQNGAATDSVLTLAGNTSSKTLQNGGGGGSVTIKDGSTGKLSIVKNGTGTQVFSKGTAFNATYTGTTTINDGTLSLVGINFNSSATTLAGGTFNLTTSTVNAAISGTSGSLTVTGGTNSNFGGGNKTYSVDTLISGTSTILTQTAANSLSATSLHSIGTGSTLRTGNLAGSVKALTGAGSVDLNGSSANLTIADGDSQDFAGVIGGTGGLTKAGTGTQTLSGTNTYTGDTTVNDGTLVLNASGSLTFKPTTNGTSNKITGTGSATLNGTLVLDLTSADLTSGNTWTLVDVTTPTYGLAGISSTGLTFVNSSGVWTATSGADTWTFTQSSGVLSHTVSAGYSSWALDKGLDGTAGHENGALDDPNNNGISNVTEYVLNGEPLLGESPAAILPTLDASGSNFVFTFTRRVESADDTTQIFEYGTDLSGWTPLNITTPTDGAVTLGTPTGGTPNLQTVTVTVAKGANTKMFGHLKVIKP